MSIRKAAVAGLFYEADPALLQQQIGDLMSGVGSQPEAIPEALIVPHAGYIYSGPIAARAYSCLGSRQNNIRRVVLFGPAHRVYLQGLALPSVDRFETPLGQIALDREAIERVIGMPGVCVSDQAHRDEHSLEVQLPFLQTVLKQFTLVPVVVGKCDAVSVATVMDALWDEEDTLIVISTDLSHFRSYTEARQVDANTCSRILAKSSSLTGEEACGAFALNGLMRTQHAQSLNVELLESCNSGDTAGDRDRVVGYGAFLLH
jgi:AmmeMemoRadiSam system protein B